MEPGRHRWLIYALGGGMGHLTRAVSLAKAIRRKFGERSTRHSVLILTNSPFASTLPIESEIGPRDRVLRISPHDDRTQVTAQVHQIFGQESIDTLIVDTFPRGIGGELADLLPSLECRKVLVHRTLRHRYVDQFSIASFARNFDQILVPGESAPLESLPSAIRTGPWLIHNSDELLDSLQARKVMRVDANRKVIAVIGCGKDDEADKMRQVASALTDHVQDRAAVCFFTPGRAGPLGSSGDRVMERHCWPFFSLIRGVSMIVGGGGYNTVHESRAAGKPLLAFAWPRLYDQQSARLAKNELVADTNELTVRVDELLRSGVESTSEVVGFRNGVDDAVEVLDI